MSFVWNVSRWDTIGFTRTFGFQERKLLARIPSSCITEGFFIRTVAFSFKSEWIPAVAVVFMIKGKVSSHPLQNLTSCLKDKCVRERDANSQRDGPQVWKGGRPKRTERGGEASWWRRRQRRGWKELIHSAERKGTGRHRETEKWAREKNLLCLEIMTVVITLFSHQRWPWSQRHLATGGKKATPMIERVATIHFHSPAALPLSVSPLKLQSNTLAGAQLYTAWTWRAVCLPANAAGLGLP